MEKIKIFFPFDDEETEFLTIQNGFKPNVIVEINNKYYRVFIYTLNRLIISYENIDKYSIKPGLILVKEASKKCTIETILSLPSSFFDSLRPKTIEEIDSILKDFRNPFCKKFSEWIQVYPNESICE